MRRVSPAIELDPIGQFGELVRQAALLYDSLWTNRYLTQRVGVGCREEAELIDSVGNHIFGSSVLTDDDVAALLVGLKHTDHLIWDVWSRKGKKGIKWSVLNSLLQQDGQKGVFPIFMTLLRALRSQGIYYTECNAKTSMCDSKGQSQYLGSHLSHC